MRGQYVLGVPPSPFLLTVCSIHCSKVCGQARAYQNKSSDAFAPYYHNSSQTLEDHGLTLTHGKLPREHIWTFSAAVGEIRSDPGVCPCTKTDTPYTGRVPPFIGTEYFCETGSRYHFQYGTFYDEDPLWDGCGPTSSCCQFNSPPWFCKELSQPTSDDIEVKVCTDEGVFNEDIAHLYSMKSLCTVEKTWVAGVVYPCTLDFNPIHPIVPV